MKPYYQRGDVTLWHADCLDVLPTLEAGSVDAVVTDPPYSLDIAQGNKGCFAKSYSKLTSDRLQIIADGFDIGWFARMCALLRVASLFCFCSNAQISRLMLALEENGYSPTLLAWHKYNSVPFSHGTWRQDAEWFVHAKFPGSPLNGNAETKRKIHRYPLCTECPEHPTAKPIALIRLLIGIVTNDTQIVLDPFTGSGTTGVACVQLGRKFIGIEIEEKYCEIAARRIDKAIDEVESEARFFAGK